MFRMSAFNTTWIFAAGEDAALDECPLKYFLVDTSLAERYLHPLANQWRCDWLFFIQDLNIYKTERFVVKYAKDLLIFVSHGMKKPYTF